MPEPSAFRVLAFDQAAERSTGILRLIGAIVVIGSALWIAFTRPSIVGWGCAALGAAGGLAWIGLVRRGQRRISAADEHYIALEPETLRVVFGGKEQEARWDEVVGVDVDEDRLVVSVTLAKGEPVLLEPTFGGLGVYDLEAAVRQAWKAAT